MRNFDNGIEKNLRGLFLFGLLILFIAPVQAQKLSAGRVMVGGSFLDLSGVDGPLTQKGHNAVGNNFLTLGVGFEQFFNRISMGFDSYNFMIRGDYNYQDFFRPSINYHYLLFKSGIIVFKQEDRMIVYPSAGIGGGRVGIRLVDLDDAEIKRSSSFGGMMEVALNARWYKLLEGETLYHMETGISIGYMQRVGADWILRGITDDSTGLIANPDGFFFRLTLGIGHWSE
jgi:hypothetical protein